jgi:hypothetical protein
VDLNKAARRLFGLGAATALEHSLSDSGFALFSRQRSSGRGSTSCT